MFMCPIQGRNHPDNCGQLLIADSMKPQAMLKMVTGSLGLATSNVQRSAPTRTHLFFYLSPTPSMLTRR
ncbi:hypothetical protein SCLCIDRAFT_1222332 [Scleroderma citrinum Foug A]|uniref:Uncharacterized protein n=1 Tax=Scleroderma citrinum Foug A TaxID=1036808 RepID=A0A0C3DC91_9AGAM|nr:hypothetical protein SCLCIDRAFT_1222332 [Scleroderma citrinum Foug A]